MSDMMEPVMHATTTLSACMEKDNSSEETINLQSSPAEMSAIVTVEDKLPGTTSGTAICIIDAIPISYKLPESHGIPGRRRNKPKPLPEYVKKNWFIVDRRRKNGRIDRYYYHKKLCFICRSLVEVQKYEFYGLRPKRANKQKENKIEDSLPARLELALTSEETEEYRKMFTFNNYWTQEISMNKNNFPTKSQKEEVEKFLRESYNNMNMSNNTSNAPNGSAPEEKMKKIKSTSRPKEGETPSSACKPLKSDDINYDELTLVDVPISYDCEF